MPLKASHWFSSYSCFGYEGEAGEERNLDIILNAKRINNYINVMVSTRARNWWEYLKNNQVTLILLCMYT